MTWPVGPRLAVRGPPLRRTVCLRFLYCQWESAYRHGSLAPHACIDADALAMGDTMRTFARTAAPPARHAEQPLPSALCLRQVFRPGRVDRPQRAYERGPLPAGLRPGLRRSL